MSVIRVYQPHTVEHMQRQVSDALQIIGERSIVFVMWNSQNVDGNVKRCPHCYDPVNGGTDTTGGICPYCFGTTYEHGIKEAHFTSVIFSAIKGESTYDKSMGEYDAENSTIQVGSDIEPHEKDYVAKIDGWNVDIRGVSPIIQESWQVKQSFNNSYFKDGFSSLSKNNVIGTVLPVGKTDQSNPISRIKMVFDDSRVMSDRNGFVVYPESSKIGTKVNDPYEFRPVVTMTTKDESVPFVMRREQ